MRVKNGNLVIVARRASDEERETCCNGPCGEGECEYTSGRIRTYNKFSVRPTYKKGTKKIRIDARIKMPLEEGLWPSFTMLPEDSPSNCSGCGYYGEWPQSGAITVAQRLDKSSEYTGGILYGGPPPNIAASVFSSKMKKDRRGYHTYSLIWTATSMTWKIDGKTVHKARSSKGGEREGWYTDAEDSRKNSPFDKPFYLMLNMAIGGDQSSATGEQIQNTLKSQKSMQVEYLRVCGK